MKIYTIWIAARLSKIYPKLKAKLDKEKVKIYIGISNFQTMFLSHAWQYLVVPKQALKCINQ
jgi:hypothetical protein